MSGQDAVQPVLQILQQPSKQLYLLKSGSRAAAAAAGGSSVDSGIQQGQALPGHTDKQAQQPLQLPQQQSQLLQPIHTQQQNPELLHAGSLQQHPQEQQHPPAQASNWPPSAQQQLPCSMPALHNGPQPATVPPAVQPVMHNQTAYATAPGAYQPWMHTGMPMDQGHPAYPPWPSYPYPYYGYPPVPAGPWGWPPMPPSWGPQGPIGGAAGPWGHPPAMPAFQQSAATEAPNWLQPLTTAAATAAAAAAAPVSSNHDAARVQQQQKRASGPSHRQQLKTEAVVRPSPGADEYSSDEDWVPEPMVGTPASTPVQVQKVVYKVCVDSLRS